MRRREKPPARVWTSADLPEHLQAFDPQRWGAAVGCSWREQQAAWRLFHDAQREWLDAHGVNFLEELRERVRARRAAMGWATPDD